MFPLFFTELACLEKAYLTFNVKPALKSHLEHDQTQESAFTFPVGLRESSLLSLTHTQTHRHTHLFVYIHI